MALESFDGRPVGGATGRSKRKRHPLFEVLQKEIVLGVLRPEQSLTEMELAQRFDCSQGTVREALMRLSEEGLVKRLPNRGTHVAPCSASDTRALLKIRQAVECDYVARIVARSDGQHQAGLHDLLNAMRNAARDHDEYRLSVHDRDFHALLFAAADLPLVAPILTRCLIHSHRFKILNSKPTRTLDATAERHAPILDALRAGDGDRLRDLLAHHVATIVDFGPDISGDEIRQ